MTREMLLSDKQEWVGTWWQPDDPAQKVSGVLTFDPERGAELRLIGGWEYNVVAPNSDGSITLSGQMRDWPVVLGAVSDGQRVTLLDVQLKTARTTYSHLKDSDGPDVLNLQPATVLVGCHLHGEDDAVFVAGAVTAENLTTWSARTGIGGSHRFGRDDTERTGEVTIRRLPAVTAETSTVTVKLHHLSRQPFTISSRAERVSRVREHASVEFIPTALQPLGYFTDLAASVVDLLSLSAMRACGLIQFRVYLPATPERYPAGSPYAQIRPQVDVFQRMVVTAEPEEPAEAFEDFVLTVNDEPFETLMPRWLDVREQFSAARGMILGLQYVPGGYLENRVITAVSAAEAMHRALQPEPPIPKAEFADLRAKILALSPLRKQWLSERFSNHANVPNLRERLVKLAERVGPAGPLLVGDIGEWARTATRARNTIAHVGTAPHALTELRAVADATVGIVVLNLLHELGVADDRLTGAVQRNPVLRRTAELARALFTVRQ
ncbi:HEPN domain-containing protein [Curtobacterium flaccumfaciens]|uniref:ApeA N-terminal domain 1-containing protein n=1 Tax=Curtobacterium flaccumfaciens TaxID=2035 RepID=UPI0039A17D69